MSKREKSQAASASSPPSLLDSSGGKAVLVEASQHTNILLLSLFGVASIVALLLAALALPVFGAGPVVSKVAYAVVVFATVVGVCVLSVINIKAHRHATVQALQTEVLLNSLGQGYLSFDLKGLCGPVYSEACLDLLETVPAGRNIVDVLHLTGEQKTDFEGWIEMLFMPNHALGFDDIVRFLPQNYTHSNVARRVGIIYRPVYDKDKKLISIIVIATDRTEEAEAEARMRGQQTFVSMVSRIFRERSQFMVTLTHLRRFVEDSKLAIKREEAASILRMLHTLKASAKHFYLMNLDKRIHKLESDLRNPSIQSDEDFQRRLKKCGEELDGELNAVLAEIGEFIGQDFEGRGHLREISDDVVFDFARLMRARKIDADLIHQYLLNIAAVPVNETFRQFDRELQDLAIVLGKKVKPVLYTGTNPRVLPQTLENFLLSSMHICRNIIDHGIEPAVTRLARGKDPAGLIMIHTDLIDNPATGGKILQIIISDDGNGIDPALVRKKLTQTDPEGGWRYDNDEQVIQRILQWGVSTSADINELSGRGVGMEAIDREVNLLGGTIKVYSELYKGTRFDIRIPYNLDPPQGSLRAVS